MRLVVLLEALFFLFFCFFFFNDTATTEIYTLSLHDALPIWRQARVRHHVQEPGREVVARSRPGQARGVRGGDRKSTRLNSSHVRISYAVFCLKKKKDLAYGERQDKFCDTHHL